jgi:hypothetical protein
MSHLSSGGDSFRPSGSIHFEGERHNAAPVHYADRSGTVRQIYALIDEAGEDLPGMGAHEMRRQLRAIGIDLGHSTDDDQDRRWTARHEAAHAAVAHALGWSVNSIDIGAGQTRCEPPDIMSQSVSDRKLQHAVIAAAGAAASGQSSDWEENESDRIAVRLEGWFDFETARGKAELALAEPYVKAIHERLTDALIQCGELHGESLRRVLEDEL